MPGGNKQTLSKISDNSKNALMNNDELNSLSFAIDNALSCVNQTYLRGLSSYPVVERDAAQRDLAVFRITKIVYDKKEDSHEKLVGVFAAIHASGKPVALILNGVDDGVEIFACTEKNRTDETENLLELVIRAQFPGTKIEKISEEDAHKMIPRNSQEAGKKLICSISAAPGKHKLEESREKEYSVQGIEKFIDGMQGQKYVFMVVATPVNPVEIENRTEGLRNLSTLFSRYKTEQISEALSSNESVTYSVTTGTSRAVNESIAKATGDTRTSTSSNFSSRGHNSNRSFGLYGMGSGSGDSSAAGSSTADAIGSTYTSTDTKGITDTDIDNSTEGSTTGTGHTMTITTTRENRYVSDALAIIDEHLERLKCNQGYGMWHCSAYVITESSDALRYAYSQWHTLVSGEDSVSPEVHLNIWNPQLNDKQNTDRLLEYLSNMENPVFSYMPVIDEVPLIAYSVHGRNGDIQEANDLLVSSSQIVSGKELPILMNFPRKSVPGLTVDYIAEFGRNVPSFGENSIRFGRIQHMGIPDCKEVDLNVNLFSSHCFICGSPGKGKTNTTFQLIDKLAKEGVKFLIIEPTKGEYKHIFGGIKELNTNIFTAHPLSFRQFRINPFEFHKNIHIVEHIDRLVGTISSCWPLYGPMPAMLKQAFEDSYKKCGWDLSLNKQILPCEKKFPDFFDLEQAMRELIEGSDYSEKSKGDYIGALLMRISSLTNGFAGRIFCSSYSISDTVLFNQNTVIDLSDIGNHETLSLVMGILIIKLREFRKATSGFNSDTKHITVLEEAHRILKRCSHEQSQDSGNIVGASVEMLTECVAEMRTYGEGFLIIDQSPTSVDEAAIKNTAIKMVMGLSAQGDCEEVGRALGLEDEQIDEIKRFDKGVACVFQEGWTEPVLAKMGDRWDTSNNIYPQNAIFLHLARVRGFVVDTMLQAFEGGKFYGEFLNDIKDDVENLCKENKFTTLIPYKIRDVIDDIARFFEINDQLIKDFKEDEKGLSLRMEQAIFDFALCFLEVSGLFEISQPPQHLCKLIKEVGDTVLSGPPAPRKVAKQYWDKSLMPYFAEYVMIPEKNLKWTKGNQGKRFSHICAKLLSAYARERKRIKDDDLWEILYALIFKPAPRITHKRKG